MSTENRDRVRRALREFRRFEGDGISPAVTGALPIGDPQSGRHRPPKSELREALEPVALGLDNVNASVAAAQTARTGAETARAGAEAARDTALAHRNAAFDAKEGAESAAIAAGASVYPDIAAGLAATGDGDIFLVPDEFSLIVYRNDNGTAVEVTRFGGFTQSGTGAVARTVTEKLRERVTLTDYFKTIDADYTNAFGRVAALAATNIELIIPPGDFPISAQTTFTAKHLLVRGAGAATRILVSGDDGWLRFSDPATATADVKRLVVQDLTVVKAAASSVGSGGVAIEAQWLCTLNHFRPCASFRNVEIVGPGSNWFAKGIRCIDGRNIVFDGVAVYNEVGHQTCLSPAGIEIVRDNAPNIFGFMFTNMRIGRVVNGILFSQKDAAVGAGTIEGIYFSGGEIVNVAYAIREDNETLAGFFIDTIALANVHWNASRCGFKAGRVRGFTTVGGHYFTQNFGETETPAPTEAGMQILLQADGIKIEGPNIFTRFTSGTTSVPMLILPDGAAVNWVRIDGVQAANWSQLVSSTGTAPVTEAKLFIGQNRLISTPLAANVGFRGGMISIGGNSNNVDGDTINFGHTFANVPAVYVNHRSNNGTVVVKPYNITTTGFQVFSSNGATSVQTSWIAVGL